MEGRHISDKLYLTLFLLLAIVLAVGIFLLVRKSIPPVPKPQNTKNKNVVKRVSGVPSETASGTMSLALEGDPSSVQYGRTARITLSENAQGAPVVGYDAVVEYDPEFLSFEGADNLLPDVFTVRVKQGEGAFTLSGSLKDSDTAPLATRSSILASLKFRTLRAGRGRVSLVFEKGSVSDSNLMDTSSRDILGSAVPLDVTVGRQMQLAAGQTQEIPGTGYKIKLVDLIKPGENCADCMEKADLELIDEAGAGHPFSFSQGGIAGEVVNEARLMGFLIAASEISQTNITIFVIPE